jgi:hypothetical protein
VVLLFSFPSFLFYFSWDCGMSRSANSGVAPIRLAAVPATPADRLKARNAAKEAAPTAAPKSKAKTAPKRPASSAVGKTGAVLRSENFAEYKIVVLLASTVSGSGYSKPLCHFSTFGAGHRSLFLCRCVTVHPRNMQNWKSGKVADCFGCVPTEINFATLPLFHF